MPSTAGAASVQGASAAAQSGPLLGVLAATDLDMPDLALPPRGVQPAAGAASAPGSGPAAAAQPAAAAKEATQQQPRRVRRPSSGLLSLCSGPKCC